MSIVTSKALYTKLLCNICSYKYGAGSKINMRLLESELNVSSIPIRENLIRLSGEDYLDFVPGSGFFTKSITESYFEKQIDYIYFETARLIELSSITNANARTSRILGLFEALDRVYSDNMSVEEYLKEIYYLSSRVFNVVAGEEYNIGIFNSLMKIYAYIDNTQEKKYIRSELIKTKRLYERGDYKDSIRCLKRLIMHEHNDLRSVCKEILYRISQSSATNQWVEGTDG